MNYEDFFAVRVEFSRAITKVQAKKLGAIYDGWKERVEKESRKIANADGDELLPIRFDGLGIEGVHAHGGASRFLSADAACAWLTKELAKDPAVVKVTFGEEDVPATPKAGATRAPSALKKELDAVLGEDKGDGNVLGRICIRFTGSAKPLTKIIAEAVKLAGDVGSIWVRGTWGKPGALEEVNQGRDLREKTGIALLERILGNDRIAHLVLSDGPRPEHKKGYWVDGCRVATSFGIIVRVDPDDRRGMASELEIYMPLEDMERWVDFGERAYKALKGTIGTFNPALWMESLRPSDLPLSLFTKLPMVAIPRIVGHHAGGFNFPDFTPDVHHGLFEPPWIAWIGAKTHRVEKSPPLEMNDARYRLYRKAWAALNAYRIRWTDEDDDNEAWRLALDRFDAPSFGELPKLLEKRHADAKRRHVLYYSCRNALANSDGKKAFAEAAEALAFGAGPKTYEVLLEALVLLKDKKRATETLAKAKPFWRDVPRLPRLAARLYLELGDTKAALAALGAATPLGDAAPDPLEKDPAFAPLHDDERFRAAFGWAARAAQTKLAAKPDLSALPKFAKAKGVAFGPPASAKALIAAETALGIKLPATYRAMLASFDGAIFQSGREVLYGTAELVAKNARDNAKYQLKIGRNLVLEPERVKAGEAPITEQYYGARSERTTLRWTKLDVCLAALAREM